MTTWSSLTGIPPAIIEAAKEMGWEKPTAIQATTIPQVLRGECLRVASATGTGKTGAFAIPLLTFAAQKSEHEDSPALSSLVVSPTPEVALQTAKVLRLLSQYMWPRPTITTLEDLDNTSNGILIATPEQLSNFDGDLSQLSVVVLDEADSLLSNKSLKQLEARWSHESHQRIVVSATLHDTQVNWEVSTNDSTETHGELPPALRHWFITATTDMHRHTALYALYRLKRLSGQVLVLVRTENSAYRLQLFLKQLGIHSAVYDRTLPTQSRARRIEAFAGSSGTSTLICALQSGREDGSLLRGIDIPNLRYVLFFEPVENILQYIHAAGRCGRNGKRGDAISLWTAGEELIWSESLQNAIVERSQKLRKFRKFQASNVAALQYRVDDALSHVTRRVSHKLRAAAVADELQHCDSVASRLSERDVELLKRVSHSVAQSTLEDTTAEVPSYLKLPEADSARRFLKRVQPSSKRSYPKSKKFVDPLREIVSKVASKRRFTR